MIGQLHRDMARYVPRSGTVKARIYDSAGITVFSGDRSRNWQDKRRNPGFVTAKKGVPMGKIALRDRFDTFEATISDCNLVFYALLE